MKKSDSEYNERLYQFTLIELLTVIAIIVILISLLFPSLYKVRDISRSIACLNNLKQNALACSSYMSDYNGNINTYITGSGMDYTWASNLYRTGYINNINSVLCSSSAPFKYDLNSSAGVNGMSKYYTYGMLEYSGAYTSDFYTYSSHTLNTNKVSRPSEYPLHADSASVSQKQNSAFSFFYSSTNFIRLAHNKKANSAFLDGHAESCTISRIKDFAAKTNSKVTLGPSMPIWVYDMKYTAFQIGP